jgi:hypothetical protein
MNIFQLGRFRIFSKNLQKFEICQSYILLISQSENIFKGIFLLRGSKRMGKSCQHILLCFLVHPNADGQSFAPIGLHETDAPSVWLLIKRHCTG